MAIDMPQAGPGGAPSGPPAMGAPPQMDPSMMMAQLLRKGKGKRGKGGKGGKRGRKK